MVEAATLSPEKYRECSLGERPFPDCLIVTLLIVTLKQGKSHWDLPSFFKFMGWQSSQVHNAKIHNAKIHNAKIGVWSAQCAPQTPILHETCQVV